MLNFGNSLFLFALAGLAVPILLHLINRELAVNLKFPSIRFIDRSQLPRREKRKLRDLLLLALRLLLFAAIVFAFAKPVWVTPLTTVAEGTTLQQTIYLVDASSSMARGNQWQAAKSALRNDLANTDAIEVGLVVYADRVLTQIPPAADHVPIENFIQDLQPSFSAGNPGTAIETAVGLFNPEAKSRLVLISDFQETDWQRDLPGVPEDMELIFLGTEENDSPNVGIANVNTVPVGKNQARVLVTVRNHSAEAQTVPVTLTGESGSEEKLLNLSAGQLGNVSFTVDVEEPRAMTASLPADNFNRDNSWHFWIAPPPVVRVYAFLPNLDEPQAVNAFYFFQTALEVESDTDWVRFEVTALDRGFFEGSLLEEADVLVIPAAGAFLRDDQWDDLKAYLDQGRTAIMLPGEAFPRQFRSLERSGMMASRFLGLAGNTNERQTPYHLGSINPSSRLSQTFADAASKDLFLVNVYRYVRLQASDLDTTLIAFENGEPALLGLAVGQGTLYASTFAFDTSWTDLPLRNSFLPLVRELVQEGFNTDRLRRQFFVEETQTLAEPVAEPGTFELDGQYWEVNMNPSESVAGKVDTDQWLPALLSQKPLYANAVPGAGTLPGDTGPKTELWPWLLMIALICILIESLLTGIKDTAQPSSLGRPNPV
ncbi:MAG: BatA domain-containing protein [Verrucomicrobia bacterium]|nr:BatA domain-containing protein [Verrucomicrobiota bacterium]MDA1069028.1 BatA domain-containing protein [Verrucomicrobiota bacterium]